MTGRQRPSTDSNPPQPKEPSPFRFTLRHLMIGIAILAMVLALAIQLVANQRRAAELERWGQSLRARERHLRKLTDDASKQAAQQSEDVGAKAGSGSR